MSRSASAPCRASSGARRAPPPRPRARRGPRPARRGPAPAARAPLAVARAAVAVARFASATLILPGFLSPFVLSSKSARSSFRRARLVPRSAPEIDAWSRSRSAASSRARPVELVVADRGRRAEEGLARDARQLRERLVGAVGSVIDSPSTSSLTVPFGPRNAFSSEPVLVPSPSARPARTRARPTARSSSPRPTSASCRGPRRAGRDPSRERELDRPLDRRLAGLVGAADDRQAGRELEVEVRVARTFRSGGW